MERLSSLFHLPEKAVAQELGMCLTSLKKIARRHGITRWPYRKLQSLKRTMEKLGEDQTSLSNIAVCMPNFPGAAIEAHRDTQFGHDDAAAAHRKPAAPAAAPHTPSPTVCSQATDEAPEDGDEERLTCSVDGHVLSVSNWSVHWTAGSVRALLLAPLGGTHITFSETGATAQLHFTTTIAAQQARRVCDAACALVGSPEACSDATDDESVSSNPCEEEEEEEEEAHGVVAAWGIQQPSSGPISGSSRTMLSPPCSLSVEGLLSHGRFHSDLMGPASHGWNCLASC
eukprot:CAMPEP_0173380212 /NCGR_PEP_ID=MMETSP1356-20130122/2943_1 /TAXON_ID=77927 ORGANISM="Hemiselmis virescens, Strain PCC157" /NCGR_SAMPLE_ID=MMETSP1356 /ASSEMBLY_ACC=CAM_ASM_000847 /LENGTH=285 /DNA_ID=CAMNT_0014333731 /DNA_START=77 /DNA_END=934 /DNA_ORIENTATION=+